MHENPIADIEEALTAFKNHRLDLSTYPINAVHLVAVVRAKIKKAAAAGIDVSSFEEQTAELDKQAIRWNAETHINLLHSFAEGKPSVYGSADTAIRAARHNLQIALAYHIDVSDLILQFSELVKKTARV